jgi:hypothetical protein
VDLGAKRFDLGAFGHSFWRRFYCGILIFIFWVLLFLIFIFWVLLFQ